MKGKKIAISLFFAVCLMISMVSCGSTASKNESEYWFSKYETRFVPYDDSANGGQGNLEEAGNYWTMTVKSDCTVTISTRMNIDYFSRADFTVNGVTVESENASDTIYSTIYKNVSLKKGDKLVFHALWTNHAATNHEGFELSVFTVNDGTGEYPISNIK